MPAIVLDARRGLSEDHSASERDLLLETEGYELLASLGIGVPAHRFVATASAAAEVDLTLLPGDRVVVKALLPDVLHKSELHAVVVVPKQREAVAATVEQLEQRLVGREVAGYTINEFVPHDTAPGAELLLGVRWTDDFGPVVTLGPGGLPAEALADALRSGAGPVSLSPALRTRARIGAALDQSFVGRFVSGRGRDGRVRVSRDDVVVLVEAMLDFADRAVPGEVSELEVNPLVFTAQGPVALDAVVRTGGASVSQAPPRPLAKLRRLLTPRSIAVMGVSESRNPGRTILENVLRAGFDRTRVAVVKPWADQIAGVPCYPDIASLPESVDLLVLSIAASAAPAAVRAIIAHRKAESVILIPGGIGERRGTDDLEGEIRTMVHEARASDWGGPVINGGNCLGVRSEPGRYDTTFLPGHKVWRAHGRSAPVAMIAQSGAFAAARSGKLAGRTPRYFITVGNQTDLTVGDYLTYLKDDPEIRVFACYVEGFQPLDGRRWLEAAAEITAGGRTVILYRAGRTGAGAAATRSHTAAVAGDYAVSRRLAEAAGVVVAERLADFDDLLRLFVLLDQRPVTGWRLGAISNAGFECVAMADRVGRFHLAEFAPHTGERLHALFANAGVDSIVDVRNPVDLTPIAGDAAFAEAATVVLTDPAVDVGVVGCVPLTGALETLTPADHHDESVYGPDAIAGRLGRLREALDKPWVAVVDGGPLYDPMATLLDELGIPTFRTADRALQMFERYCEERRRIQGVTDDALARGGRGTTGA